MIRPALSVLLAVAAALAATAGPAAAAQPSSRVFASGDRSKPIVCDGRSDVKISGLTFVDLDDSSPAITVRDCRRVVIEHNDFLRVAEPIYVVGSREVVIRHNRYRDITGPFHRNGSHRGNFTQWERSFGGSITDNVGIGGDTEDVISLYRSGGLSSRRPLVVARNRFKGSGWRSPSGSGILVGDGGGAHVVVRRNVLVDVGQVGIGVAGGRDIRIVENTVVGTGRRGSNVGIYVWAQGAACTRIRVARNAIQFTKPDGTPSTFWDGGNCGRVSGATTNGTGLGSSRTAGSVVRL